MYHPTTRVLAVLALLRAHGRMSGAELARRLEINSRTLRRYITMLQDLGIPIVAGRGRHGAYELESSYKLPPMMFTNDEAVALAIGLLAVRRLALAGTVQAVESVQAKLEQAMPLELKQQVWTLSQAITFEATRPPIISSGDAMLTLSSATQHRRRVQMRYRSEQGQDTDRLFDPYGLAHRQGRWYVVGWCGLRQHLRSFRVDRVVTIEMIETTFERPEDFDALTHVVQSIASLPRQYSFTVLLKTDLETAQKEVTGVFGVLEPCDEGIRLRGSADSLDWVVGQLAQYAFDFVIEEPDELRDALRSHVARLTRLMDHTP
jgi:predicted DNA-binding transcriptional regulator YafY